MLTIAYSFKLLFAYNLMFGLCYYKITIYNILLKLKMLFNKTTRIPGLKIIFKGLQTQQPFKDIIFCSVKSCF